MVGGRLAWGGGLFALSLILTGVSTAARAQSLEPVGSAEALSEIVDQAQPDCAADPTLCPAADGDMTSIDEVVVTGSRVSAPVSTAAPSITNNQVTGVDEGDIVKARGDTLIILRRGRLFTVSTANGRMRPVDHIDAYPPGVSASGDWYDEMLIFGDMIVVVGYSYARDGMEINRFTLDAAGRLTFLDNHSIASNDYYSSRNYASRLNGSRLILYAPSYLHRGGKDPMEQLPTMTSRVPGPKGVVVHPLVTTDDVFISPELRGGAGQRVEAIHAVVNCDLAAPVFSCSATAVMGPGSRGFYVANDAAYLWLTGRDWGRQTNAGLPASAVFRIPLNGDRPQAIRTRGSPIDQFSFNENAADRTLDVLVVSRGGGDAMWRPEFASGGAALLRLPLTAFGDGSTEADADFYRMLPPLGSSWGNQNRFVGAHLLYSQQTYDPESRGQVGILNVVPVAGGPARSFLMPGGVSRIEQMGQDALVMSGEEDLVFSTVGLGSGDAQIIDRYALPNAEEAESRSHAFFYSPDPGSADGSRGVLGLPVMREVSPDDEDYGDDAVGDQTWRTRWSADVAFLRRGPGGLSPLGALSARPGAAVNDRCTASCVDWYGDARPIFWGERVFALLGYELVEGGERRGRIREVGRISFIPTWPTKD